MTTPEPTRPAEPAFRPTTLTDAQLATVRERAARLTSSMVDPFQVARVMAFIDGRDEWVRAILGRRCSRATMTNRDIVLLDTAATEEPHPPEPPRPPGPGEPGYQPTDAEQAVERYVREAQEAWRNLSAKLPVGVRVSYNYSGRVHTPLFVSGAEHILVTEELHSTRFTREPDQPLCKPSRRVLCNPAAPADDERFPTCKECIRRAARLAGVKPPEVLMHGKRGPALPRDPRHH